ncbi:uncharacterized protein MKK02DRAFT_37837 [Dioszegia hungarica]|uniref:Zinc finger PHD-type domain-containing protein n=1 Tax=Dioszegia hungarica TaxID=4972 RepID=A0AA38LRX0_9TREE|nr:uncharacterized protein MKK02DRAFT_37837 [Dioszegia hungarica]KAI9634962.1 hypothetical protein MKK02DRAFT_37837 [Dioszegia hungarica]
MTDTRRRPSASATPALPDSRGTMSRRGGASVRSLSSGSITPMEDEEDRPKRSTRGRNPLPPTKGPLFPPLPPKPLRPKASPKHSQTSATNSYLPAEENAEEEDDEPVAGPSRSNAVVLIESSSKRRKEDPSTPEGDKQHVPSGSGASLTPPPPSSDPVHEGEDEEVEATGSRRKSRAGNGVMSIGVKVELMEAAADNDEAIDLEDTPKQQGATRGRLVPPASAGTTPTDSATSERGGNARTSLGRRRRGEEQLLLDDHLLPEEIRRTGTLINRRKSQAADQMEELAKPVEPEAEEEDGDKEEEDTVDVAVAEEQPAEKMEGAVEEEPLTDDIVEQSLVDPDEEDPGDEEGDEVTRCVCQLEDGDPLMVACDKCNVWQHGPCVGIWADEEAPDEYFCEQCRPELHGPLRKWMRSKGRNILNFVPPSPEDLKGLHVSSDRYPPSQSKRWITPATKGKSHSRSRAKEPAASPVAEPNELRRQSSRRGELAPSLPPAPARTSSQREKSAKAEGSRTGRDQRRGSSHHRKASEGRSSHRGERDSRSPGGVSNGTGQKEKEPRKRSTMNSRDAAFENEAFMVAIEASKREQEMAGKKGEEGDAEELAEEAEEEERGREVERKHKGKRKREEDADPNDPSHPSHPKVKHPNQYTYRPKPAAAAVVVPPPAPSPARRVVQGTTPVPQIPPPALHEHGTRRAGALATGAREAPFIAVSVTHLGWHLPDYLSAFADIFPSPNPTPLQVRSPRALPPISKNHFLNHRFGPFTEVPARRDGKADGADGEEGDHADEFVEVQHRLMLPPDPPEREALGKKGETHTEPPARMKYPQRRVTTAEMRKRVLHMLEFCGRVEVEEGKRKQRKNRVGIPDAVREAEGEGDEKEKEKEAEGGIMNGDVEMVDGQDIPNGSTSANGESFTAANGATKRPSPDVAADATTSDPQPTSTASGPTSAQLLAELTADLLDFQDTWARGGFAANGSAGMAYSPAPPSSATFAQAGSGWPSSQLGRDVMGPEEAEEGEQVEMQPEEQVAPGLEGGEREDGDRPENVDSPPAPDGPFAPGSPLVTSPADVEADPEPPLSMDVYRMGEVPVSAAVATEAEEAVVQLLKDNAQREEQRAHEEAEVGPEGTGASGSSESVSARQVNGEGGRLTSAEGGGQEDVVMAE